MSYPNETLRQVAKYLGTYTIKEVAEAIEYYVGTEFNFGDTDSHPKDKMVKCISIEVLD